MTENWFEHDRKIFTLTNFHFEFDRNSRHRLTLPWRQKNMLVRSAWTGPPAPARKLALAGTPAQPRFAPLQEKKTSGTEIRRTPDVKLRFVGFRRFVGFNFGQVQLLRFVIVMIRSNSFGHLHSVMLTFLNKSIMNWTENIKTFDLSFVFWIL